MTGAAGFIGFHVSNALATQWRATVVGVDSYTESYDVQLKWDRTNELIKAGVHMYRGDVCDQTLLSFLFEKFNFTSVVHLAAQAGVRYSLEHPLHFIHSNIECYITLLNLIKAHKVSSHLTCWGILLASLLVLDHCLGFLVVVDA